MRVSALQTLEPQYWGKVTTEENLAVMGMIKPQYISNLIDMVYEVNYGADNIVSLIDRFPVRYLDEDNEYRWRLQGSEERSIELVAATLTNSPSASQITDADRAGLGFSEFYVWFAEDFFSITSVMAGNKPEKFLLRSNADPIQVGGYFGYKVQIVGSDPDTWIEAEDLAASTLWSEMYGLVEKNSSVRGNEVKHASHFEFQNRMSVIRKQYEVQGNMISKGKNAPMAFAFSDQDGVKHTAWIGKLEWDFLKQFRRDKGRLLLYGKSTVNQNGESFIKGETGNSVYAGYGLYEQMEGGNLLHYNDFSLKMLTDFAMGMMVGKVKEDKRELVMSTGEWGLYQIHKAIAERGAEIGWLRSNHNFSSAGNGKMKLSEGQFIEYEFINGIKFKVVLDPIKDDPVHNKIKHPNGGLASSYIYDIWDFGTTNGNPNIQRVAQKDNEELYFCLNGIRDPHSAYNNLSAPRSVNSFKDGYMVGKWYQGGIQLNNPLKTGRIYPTMLK